MGEAAGGDEGNAKAAGAVGAVGGALQLMAQALGHMQEAMQAMTVKMYRTDEAVHSVEQTVQRLEVKLDTIERGLHVALQRGSGDRSPCSGFCVGPPAAAAGAAVAASPRRQRSRRQPAVSMVPLEGSASSKHLLYMLLLNKRRQPVAVCEAPSPTSPKKAARAGAMPAYSLASPSATSSTASSSSGEGLALRTSGAALQTPAAPRRVALGRNLLRAAQEGNMAEVRRALKEGADVNFSNSSKWTPLHMASVKAHADILSLLLERGADASATNSFGFTPLHMAAHNDRSGRCASLLIYAGSDVDCANRFARTPLHYAAECGNEAAVRALLAAGASRNVVNDEGRSPFHVAKTECLRRLLAPFSVRSV